MNGVDRPVGGKRYKDLGFYDEDQLKQLFDVLDAVYPAHAIQIKLAALVGLRAAEISGIRLENINYKNNTILIDKTLLYDKETKRFLLGPTKTKKPRTVSVPQSLMEEIKQYEIKQKKLKLALGDKWNPMLDENGEPINLLITKTDGFPSYPKSMSNRFKEILERFDLPPLNFHGLRHTYASYALSQGVNFKVIQEHLGHANIQETMNTYSHLTMKDKKEASDLFNHFL
jgi:integrase